MISFVFFSFSLFLDEKKEKNKPNLKTYKHYYDCTGNVLYEWNGTGLARVHSNELAYCGPLKNSGVLVKNCGTAHGLFDTALPCTNWSQIIYRKITVATTEIIDPILEIRFHAANASG